MRYLGAPETDAGTRAMVEEMATLLEAQVTPRYVYRVAPIRWLSGKDEAGPDTENGGADREKGENAADEKKNHPKSERGELICDPGGTGVQLTGTPAGKMLEERDAAVLMACELSGTGVQLTRTLAWRMLEECDAAVLMACTLGAGFERLLRAWEVRDMARAAVLDACGSAYVEAGCDAAEEEIRARCAGKYLTDRFSPGYGDLPLDVQGTILEALNGGRRLGLQATESWLLNPAKSVTAIIGLSEKPQGAKIRGCGVCRLRDHCAYRERGTRCVLE